jgi:hypothetical protein
MKGDNPSLLLQDCDSKLSKWFASRPDARYVIRKEFIMPTEVTITAYKYEELDGRAKEKAHAKLTEWIADHEWWDYIFENAKIDGDKLGFEVENIEFSGFSSQGDGASWTGRIDMPKFVEVHMEPDSAWYGEDVILLALWSEGGWIDRFISMANHNYRYYHSGGMSISDYPSNALSLDPDDDAVLGHGALAGASIYQLTESFDYEQRITEWCDEALKQARSFADDIYKKLEAAYDDLTSEESLIDFAEGNNYLFDERGNML